MAECMICGGEILGRQVSKEESGLADTLEHLLPLSIGGRRGVYGFIHRACNGEAGETWDAALAEQLQPLSLMFDIARQSGDVPSLKVITTEDEHFSLGPNGQLRHANPIFKKSQLSDGTTHYQISARDPAEARKMLSGLKRKHPQIDVEAILAQARIEESYAKGAVHHQLQIGGEEAGRSIVKSCLAIAFDHGIDWRLCDFALDYMRDPSAKPCFGYYQEDDLVTPRPPGMPLHCLAVKADSSDGLIMAYAEYYGMCRVVACLGEGYNGPPRKGCYAIDPRDGSTQNVTVELPFNLSDIEEIYAYKRFSREVMKSTADAVIGPAVTGKLNAEQQRLISTAVNKGFDTCGAKPGERLTTQHLESIARTVAEKMAPFMAHRMKPIRPPPNRKARRANQKTKKQNH